MVIPEKITRRIVSIAVGLLCTLGGTNAQNPILWNRLYGGSGEDVAVDILIHNNLYYVLGYTNSINGDINTSYGAYDIWLLALDPVSGSILWQQSYGHSLQDIPLAIYLMPDSSTLAIAGYTASFDGIFYQNHGGYDLFMLYVNASDGTLRKAKVYGGIGNENPIGGGVGYYPALETTIFTPSHSTLGDIPCLPVPYPVPNWILGIDTTGNIITSFCKDFEHSAGYLLYLNNHFYQATYGEDSLTFPASNGSPSRDFILYKLDAGFNPEWRVNYDSALKETLYGALATRNGCILMYGLQDAAMFLVKVDSLGNRLWSRTIGTGGGDMPYKLTETSDSGFILMAQVIAAGGDVGIHYGMKDVWLVKIDNQGNLVWERTYGGSNNDYPRAVAMDQDGSLVVAAESRSTDGHLAGFTNPLGKNMWLFKLASWVGTDHPDYPYCIKPLFYPNPIKSGQKIMIRNLPADFHTYQMVLSDITGKSLCNYQLSSNGIAEIQLPVLSDGIYLIDLRSGTDYFFIERIIVHSR
jgi:hypothetical protein